MSALQLFKEISRGSALLKGVLKQQQLTSWQYHYLLGVYEGSSIVNGPKIKTRWNSMARLDEFSYYPFTYKYFGMYSRIQYFTTNCNPNHTGKTERKASAAATTEYDIFGETSKLGLFQKFKLMYKKYWYVLVPVHVVTSIGWLGAFYYLSKSGVDIPGLLQSLHLSESIIEKVKHSDMGHVAIAYLCYKIATPVRYAMTLGGTTFSIKHLVNRGYIKPMPTKNELLQMYEDRKAIRAAAKAKEEADAEDASTKRQKK